MVRKKPTAHFIWAADMALTARSVALLAVILKSCGERRTLFQVPTPGFKNCLKATEGGMKAVLIHMGNIFMAGIAITLGWVSYQTHVGSFLYFDTAVATVTDNAANLTVGTLHKFGVTQEDLFPYLQRR